MIIWKCIDRNFKDCTIINISNSLFELGSYDRIVVMDKGEIVEIGSP